MQTPATYELDEIDRILLRELSQNARASGAALAKATHTAESTVSTRLRRLQEAGIITGFRTEIDLRRVGMSLEAMLAVRLSAHDQNQVLRLERQAAKWPGVLGVFHTSGPADYYLHVVTRNTDTLRAFVVEYLLADAAVQHVETHLIFSRVAGTGWMSGVLTPPGSERL